MGMVAKGALGTVLTAVLAVGRAAAEAPTAPTGPSPAAAGRGGAVAPNATDALAQAKTMFRAANEARRGGALREAIRLYAQSRALVPSVPNTLNAALCHADLGELDRALELYEELQQSFGAELDALQIASLEERIASLRSAVARVELGASLAGELEIDGVVRAALPSRGHVYLMPGAHRLRLIAAEGPARRLTVTLSARDVARFDEQTAELEPPAPSAGGSTGAPDREDGRATRASGAAVTPADAEPIGLWLSPTVGLLVASGVGSGAAANCAEACESSGPALGFSVGLTAGYELAEPLSLELAVHYGALSEERTRIVRSSFADTASGRSVATSFTIRDQISLAGPVVGAGLGLRWSAFEPLVVGAHTLVGFGYFNATDDVDAAASADGRTLEASLENSGVNASGFDLLVLETVDVGWRLDPVTFRIGLTATFGLLEGPAYETGDLVVVGGSCARPGSDVVDCAPGSDAASAERAWGPFVLWSPFAGATFEL